ncbi:phosphotransferase enzyme family protein [Xylariomycetidae sp. FL2044]|nr:phosphotransferase enzyme family protein [Xylariomycetidae sp. FL2044]
MARHIDPEHVASLMLSWHSLELVACRKLQSLWAGYGHICEVTARATTDTAAARLRKACPVLDGDTDSFPLILKLISPPSMRGDTRDEGHLRKMMSYEVEQYFYDSMAPSLDSRVSVAQCIATTREKAGKPGEELLDGLIATVMTDLRPQFPVAGEKRAVLNQTQVLAALDWLSGFHGKTWKLKPDSFDKLVRPPLEEATKRKGGQSGTQVWLNGGYTYLATRRKEYADLAADDDSEWTSVLCEPITPEGLSISEVVAQFLTPRGREYETYIHGDVKSENLFTTESGQDVAFFDFQYVGLGFGVCDLAKLFTCSVPLRMLVDDESGASDELQLSNGERTLLERYRSGVVAEFQAHGGRHDVKYEWEIFIRHWETALVDWLRFEASWGFWGNTQWLEARVRSILNDDAWREWLLRNYDTSE